MVVLAWLACDATKIAFGDKTRARGAFFIYGIVKVIILARRTFCKSFVYIANAILAGLINSIFARSAYSATKLVIGDSSFTGCAFRTIEVIGSGAALANTSRYYSSTLTSIFA